MSQTIDFKAEMERLYDCEASVVIVGRVQGGTATRTRFEVKLPKPVETPRGPRQIMIGDVDWNSEEVPADRINSVIRQISAKLTDYGVPRKTS